MQRFCCKPKWVLRVGYAGDLSRFRAISDFASQYADAFGYVSTLEVVGEGRGFWGQVGNKIEFLCGPMKAFEDNSMHHLTLTCQRCKFNHAIEYEYLRGT